MNIRKHISALLTFLILASNMGLALNVHYCHGNVSSVSLAYKLGEPCNDVQKKESKSCCAAATESHKKCCKNDLVKLQDTKSAKVIVKSLQLDLGTFCAINDEWKPTLFYDVVPTVKEDNPSSYCDSHAPPLFKLYCQYIFYA